MRRFPRLSLGSTHVDLPLCDATSVALVDALLVADRAERASSLVELLARDPALALWSVCRIESTDQSPRTVKTLVAWLAEHLADTLIWPEDDLGDVSARVSGEQFAAMAEAAVLVSDLVVRRVEKDQLPNVARDQLLGLLYQAEQWLSAVAEDATDALSLLPDDLRSSLDLITRRDTKPDTPEMRVAEAIDLAADAAAERSLSTELLESLGISSEAVRQHWLTSAPHLADRLPALARCVARLQQLERPYQEALQTEKLESLRQLAYGASHEINNPLANIATRAQSLLIDEIEPDRRRKLAAINSQAFRATEMISDMMLFARPPKLDVEPIDLLAVVRDVVENVQPQAAEQAIEIQCADVQSAVTVSADATQLTVALRALCMNSIEAIGAGGRIDISVQRVGGQVELTVSDDGPGITDEVRRHLFDPFYSGREAGRGLGFGLSKCWRIVTDHGGQVAVDSQPGRGATFTITLPIAQ
jgi:signal transduction histidine kinase